jgi:hypothetical protein
MRRICAGPDIKLNLLSPRATESNLSPLKIFGSSPASTFEFEFEEPMFQEKQCENKALIETQCSGYITFVYGVSISINPCQVSTELPEKLKPEGKSVFCSPVACSAVQDVGV